MRGLARLQRFAMSRGVSAATPRLRRTAVTPVTRALLCFGALAVCLRCSLRCGEARDASAAAAEQPTFAGGMTGRAAASGMRLEGLPAGRRGSAGRAAVPELQEVATLLLANTGPTTSVVSVAFNTITFAPQYLWLAMVFAPNWDVTKKVMTPWWPVLLAALVHLFIVFVVASTNDDNLADFTELANVFNPKASFTPFSDFSTQAAMMNLMKSPGFVSEEWSHVLAWDLFVGRWIYLDGQRRGIFTSHSVLLCNLIGPPGLLMHALTCMVLGRGLPDEDGKPSEEST